MHVRCLSARGPIQPRKLGANSIVVPSWGREGPRRGEKESKPAAPTICLLQYYVFHDLGVLDTRGKKNQDRHSHQLAEGASPTDTIHS